MTKIFLKRGKEESLGRRHPWVFSGAIERMEGEPAEGDVVDVYSRQGEFLARGHYQIGSITVRILTFVQAEIDARWWLERLRAAVGVRRAVGLVGNPMTDCYRLVHGEGDGLPGLVVDIYGDTAVVQAHSVGMYRSRDAVCDALRRVYGGALAAVYDKSAQTLPYKADTGACDGYLYGGDGTTERIVTENGNRFHVDWGAGQKTGFFLDQRENRELVRRYSSGRAVLNTFSYTGGFSVYASGGRGGTGRIGGQLGWCRPPRGAECRAQFRRRRTARGGGGRCVRLPERDGRQFRPRHSRPSGLREAPQGVGQRMKGYMRLNARALSQIAPGGILFTFSCSQAVSRELFRTAVFTAAAVAGRNVRILHQLTQPADHPVNIYHRRGST